MKTREEVENLKESWLLDPIFDIEHETGYEEYKEELTEFANQHRERWREQANRNRRRRYFYSGAFGVPPAFFSDGSQASDGNEGLTMREYFAAAAMQGLLANGRVDYAGVAEFSVKMADAVIVRLFRSGK